ncbi:MAG: hypothetical protein ACJATP_000130 [Candidatus Azotimanducaceae bacterium]|jgi:hypothetical protein
MNISACSLCGGEVKIFAYIDDPEIIEKILPHLDTRSDAPTNHLPKPRASPQAIAIHPLVIRKLMRSEQRDRLGF